MKHREMQLLKRLGDATEQLLRSRRVVIAEWSGDIKRDMLKALEEVNALRAPFLAPIEVEEAESYPGQLTDQA